MPPVPVSKPFVRPTAAAAAEGAAVALTCTVREGTEPLSFSWQHQDPRGGPSITPAGLGGSRAELQLTPANRSHTGWYICTVHNEVNNYTSDPVYLDIVCECPGCHPPRGALSHQLGGASLGLVTSIACLWPPQCSMAWPWPLSTLPPWYVHNYHGTSMDIMYPATVMPPWPPLCLRGHHGMAYCCFDVFMAIIHPTSKKPL